jgi:hypothetical protein
MYNGLEYILEFWNYFFQSYISPTIVIVYWKFDNLWGSWALILKRTLSNVIEVSCPNHTSHTPYLTQKHTHHNEKPSLLLMNSTINFVWAKQSNYLSQARKQPSLHWFFNQNDNKGKFSSKSTSWNKKKTRTWTQHVQNNNPIRFFYKEE